MKKSKRTIGKTAAASSGEKPPRPPAVGSSPGANPDDAPVTALALRTAPLSETMAPYFAKCEEKLGFVPNVLTAYAFDMPKLEAFVAMYNDLMLAPSGLSKLEREMRWRRRTGPRCGSFPATRNSASRW